MNKNANADAKSMVKSMRSLRPREPRQNLVERHRRCPAWLPLYTNADANRGLKPNAAMRPREPRQRSDETQLDFARLPLYFNGETK
jgi:hypothetical protein